MSIFDTPRQVPRIACDEIEAAKALGISPSTLRECVRTGLLRRVKFGRATRFLVSDLQLLAERLREPEREAEQSAARDQYEAECEQQMADASREFEDAIAEDREVRK